jgi:hypothetical protein
MRVFNTMGWSEPSGSTRTRYRFSKGRALVKIVECRVRQIPLLAGSNRGFTVDRGEENQPELRLDPGLRRVAGLDRRRHAPGLLRRVSRH